MKSKFKNVDVRPSIFFYFWSFDKNNHLVRIEAYLFHYILFGSGLNHLVSAFLPSFNIIYHLIFGIILVQFLFFRLIVICYVLKHIKKLILKDENNKILPFDTVRLVFWYGFISPLFQPIKKYKLKNIKNINNF